MKSFLACLAAAAGLAAVSAPAHAAIVIDITQAGANVDMVGYGSANLAALTFNTSAFPLEPQISARTGSVIVGDHPSLLDFYTGIVGPKSFGTRFSSPYGNGSGEAFGIKIGQLVVPSLYVSGTPLGRSTAVFDNETLAGLTLVPGTYVWTWGQGADADSLTLNIGVPEPATWAMLILGVAMIGLAVRRRGQGLAA